MRSGAGDVSRRSSRVKSTRRTVPYLQSQSAPMTVHASHRRAMISDGRMGGRYDPASPVSSRMMTRGGLIRARSICARHPSPQIIHRLPLIFSRRHPDALKDASGIAQTLRSDVGYETIMVSIPVRTHFSPAGEEKFRKRG